MKDTARTILLASSVMLLLVAAACASPPTEEAAPAPEEPAPDAAAPDAPTGDGGTADADSASDTSTFEGVYAAVEGLDDEAREERLIELAEECGGSVNVYSTMNGEEGPESMALFEEQTGIGTDFYRASSTDVLNRVLQEHDAGFDDSADVVTAGYEMMILQEEGLLAPLETSAEDELPEGAVSDHLAWVYLNVFTPAWNTDAISAEEAPQTWTDVFTNYPGELVFEVTDWDFFYRVVPLLMEENDISEEEAIDMVGEAIREAAAIVRGHTTMSTFVAAGQYQISASSYHNAVVDLVADGAPIAWEPPVDPLIILPFVAGLNADAPCPAGAVLFMDYFLTDAQNIMAEHDREPANTTIEGRSLPPEYNTVAVDLETMVEDQERWETMYNDFIQQSGLPVQEE